MSAKYYAGSLTFIFGIIIALIGIGFAISVKLTRYSDPSQIEFTYSSVGLGLAVALLGLNLMIKKRAHYVNYITILGISLCSVGLVEFVTYYPQNWKYPYVTYVVISYAVGLALLVGNSFANAVLNLIEGKPVISKKEELTEEDIEREVERVISESMDEIVKLSEAGLKFKDVSTEGFRPSKAFFERKDVVVLKDNVREAEILKNLELNRVEVKDKDLDEEIKLLKETINSSKNKQEKKFRLFR